ncbi:MAG: LacI family DNA-binding transcriptional regulator [Gammaproteobacteria bacterium]
MPPHPARSAKKPNINDVAKQAGVSIKTVSRVLNREPRVREATRARVEEAIKHLKYRPNSPGRMLAGSRTYLLGLIYNSNSSYITSIQNGALEACHDEHYDLLIHPCRYTDPTLVDQLRALLDTPRVDGLLLTPPLADQAPLRELMQELDVPYIALSSDAAQDEHTGVSTNDHDVCMDMVRYLSRLGHERIAFVRGHVDHKAMTSRYQGFVDGMAEAGLKVRSSFVIQGQNTFESGIDCGIRLMRNKVRPTAVFCSNDHMAAGVMKVVHEMGLSIPGDVSVAGFDDIPMAAQVWPALTTVRQPLNDMARLAARMLIDYCRDPQSAPQNHVVNAEIIVRGSTGSAPRS